MELKYKEQKLRDLFVYQLSIYPVDIDIRRHEIIFYVKEYDLKEKNLNVEDTEKFFSSLLNRKTILKLVKEDD